MSVEIRIPDDDLTGFSEQARELLKEATAEYATNLVEESNRIEAGRNSTSGPPEITRGMVDDARVLLRRGLGMPRKGWGSKVLRILAAVSSLAVGVSYNKSELQNSGGYLLFFILLVAVAILAVTVATLKE